VLEKEREELQKLRDNEKNANDAYYQDVNNEEEEKEWLKDLKQSDNEMIPRKSYNSQIKERVNQLESGENNNQKEGKSIIIRE